MLALLPWRERPPMTSMFGVGDLPGAGPRLRWNELPVANTDRLKRPEGNGIALSTREKAKYYVVLERIYHHCVSLFGVSCVALSL